MAGDKKTVSRRKFLAKSVAGVAAAQVPHVLTAQENVESRQATGVKVGEVSDTSAIVLLRLTAQSGPNAKGKDFPRGTPRQVPKDIRVDQLRGACPGAAGLVRLRYGTNEDLSGAKNIDWQDVTAKTDFSRQIRLTGLQPSTTYYYAAETAGPGGKPTHAPLRGRFQTAPPPDRYADVNFTDGFHIFPSMAALRTNFYVHTGDNVYYDSDIILASGVELARHHWHRMHSLPRHVAFHLRVPGYFEKDDHDTLQVCRTTAGRAARTTASRR
jgi:alkaline phosphatase D